MVVAALYSEMAVRSDAPADKVLNNIVFDPTKASTWIGTVTKQNPFILNTLMWSFPLASPTFDGSAKVEIEMEGDILLFLAMVANVPAICAYNGSGDEMVVATGADCPYWTLDGVGLAMYKSITLNTQSGKYDERTPVSLHRDMKMYNRGDHKALVGKCATASEAQLFAKRSRVLCTPVHFSFMRDTTSGLRLNSMVLSQPKLEVTLNKKEALIVNPAAATYPYLGVRPDYVSDDVINARGALVGAPTPCAGGAVQGVGAEEEPVASGPRRYRIEPLRDTDVKVRMYGTFALLGEDEAKAMEAMPTHSQFVSKMQHSTTTINYVQNTANITADTPAFPFSVKLQPDAPVQAYSLYFAPSMRKTTGRSLDFSGIFDPVSQSDVPAVVECGIATKNVMRTPMLPGAVLQNLPAYEAHRSGVSDNGYHFVCTLDPTAADFTGASNNAAYMNFEAQGTLDPRIFKEDCSAAVTVNVVMQTANVLTYYRKIATSSF